MVMPSSTPRLLGSFTWKVPLLGTTDSVNKRTQSNMKPMVRAQRSSPTSTLFLPGETPQKATVPTPPCFFHLAGKETEAQRS
jgi:hypothetical protein